MKTSLYANSAVEQSPVSIVITDLLGGIEYVNPKFCTLTGYSFEEVRGENARGLQPGKMSVESYRQMWAAVAAGEEWRGEFHNRKKNGELYWESASISPIRDDQGMVTHFVAIKEDITQVKRATEELQRKTAFLEAQIHSSMDGILVLDEHGRKALQNQRMVDLLKIPHSIAQDPDAETQRQWIVLMSKTPQRFIESVEYIRSHPTQFNEEELEMKDGTIFIRYSWPMVGKDGNFYGRVVTFRDITERKRAEETLRVKDHLLSESQRLGHVGSWLSDAKGPTSWSEETYRIYGVSAETFTPSMESLLSLVHPDDRQAVQVWQTRCAAGEQPPELEFRINRPDGAIRFIKRNGEAVFDAQNRFVHMAGTTQDITERTQAQAERKSLEQRLAAHKASEESARLALDHEQQLSQTKSRFVSMVSHEFRTPLSIINMAAELLAAYGDKMTTVERSDQLQEILGAVGRMTQMMTDFLVHDASTSGKMECKPERVMVGDLCRHLIAEATSHSVAPRTIELLVDPAIGESFLDEKIFRHILGNLLSNALKYSSDGQPVKLEVRRIAGSTQPNGGKDVPSETHLEFKVSDSGIGIPAADMAKLYQTFHRAANVGSRPGTGMGLAIVKQFVDLHRGTIRFESKEGKGTTVWVHLPAALPTSQKRI
jgi:PAS domain S-box-containing protein